MEKIFITGFWNSGTTILARMLITHPEFFCFMSKGNKNRELNSGGFIADAITACRGARPLYLHGKEVDYDYMLKHGFSGLEIGASGFEDFAQIVEQNWNEGSTSRKFVKNNRLILCKDLLDAAFPDSKRIIILRDGRSYAISKCWDCQYVRKAKHWVNFMNYVFEKWWGDPNTFFMRYENLCNQPEVEMARLLEFLGAPNSDDMWLYEIKSRNYKWDEFLKKERGHAKNVEAEVGPTNQKLNDRLPILP